MAAVLVFGRDRHRGWHGRPGCIETIDPAHAQWHCFPPFSAKNAEKDGVPSFLQIMGWMHGLPPIRDETADTWGTGPQYFGAGPIGGCQGGSERVTE